jgi:hypothetical protein
MIPVVTAPLFALGSAAWESASFLGADASGANASASVGFGGSALGGEGGSPPVGPATTGAAGVCDSRVAGGSALFLAATGASFFLALGADTVMSGADAVAPAARTFVGVCVGAGETAAVLAAVGAGFRSEGIVGIGVGAA